MKTFSPAASPQDDSLAYRLLSIDWCLLDQPNQKLRIYYVRDGKTVGTVYTYKELDEVVAGFSDALTRLADQSLDITAYASAVRATAAYIFGSYVDVRTAGNDGVALPYICSISSVSSASAEQFYVDCLSFDIVPGGSTTIPLVSTLGEHRCVLTGNIMNRLWPDSATQVLLMETLGYSGAEIALQLNAAISRVQMPTLLPNLDLG